MCLEISNDKIEFLLSHENSIKDKISLLRNNYSEKDSLIEYLNKILHNYKDSVIYIHLSCLILQYRPLDIDSRVEELVHLTEFSKFKYFIPDFTGILTDVLSEIKSVEQKKNTLIILKNIFLYLNSEENSIFHAISEIFGKCFDLNDEFFNDFFQEILKDFSNFQLTNKGFLRFLRIYLVKRSNINFNSDIFRTLCSGASWNQISGSACDCIKLLLNNGLLSFNDIFRELFYQDDLKFSNIEVIADRQLIEPTENLLKSCFGHEHFVRKYSELSKEILKTESPERLKNWLFTFCYFSELDKDNSVTLLTNLDPYFFTAIVLSSNHFDDDLRFQAFKTLKNLLSVYLLRSSDIKLPIASVKFFMKEFLKFFESSVNTSVPKIRSQTLKVLSEFLLVTRDAASTASYDEAILEGPRDLERGEIGLACLKILIEYFIDCFNDGVEDRLFPIGLPYSSQVIKVNLLSVFYENLNLCQNNISRRGKKISYTPGTLDSLKNIIKNFTIGYDWHLRQFPIVIEYVVNNLPNLSIDLQEIFMKILYSNVEVNSNSSTYQTGLLKSLQLLANSHELTHYTAFAHIAKWLVSIDQKYLEELIAIIIASNEVYSNGTKEVIVKTVFTQSCLGYLTFLEKLFDDSELADVCLNKARVYEVLVEISKLNLFSFEVMGGKKFSLDQGGNYLIEHAGSTSFEGIAISIMKSCSSDIDSALLSTEYQRLMSWSWHTVMITCSVLSKWSRLSVSKETISDRDHNLIRDVGFSLMHILLTCRHRGTIETVGIPLTEYLTQTNRFEQKSVLLNSEKVLNYCFLTLTKSKYSVSRRSAGLWHLVKGSFYAMISSNSRKTHYLFNNKVLMKELDRWIRMLYDLSRSEESLSSYDLQNDDDPRALAMHIMRGLFSDSKISPYLMALDPETGEGDWLSKTLIDIVSPHFCHSMFRISNAAFQLYTALLQKLVGVVMKGSGPFFHEIFGTYPSLLTELNKKLTHIAHSENEKKILILWLTLLSSTFYSPRILNFNETIENIIKALKSHLYGRTDYHIRKLAALSIVNMISPKELCKYSGRLIQHIFFSKTKPVEFKLDPSYGEILGELLLLEAFFCRKFLTYSDLQENLIHFNLKSVHDILVSLINAKKWRLADLLCRISTVIMRLMKKIGLKKSMKMNLHLSLECAHSGHDKIYYNYLWSSYSSFKFECENEPIAFAEPLNTSAEGSLLQSLMVDEALIKILQLNKNLFSVQNQDLLHLIVLSLSKASSADINLRQDDAKDILDILKTHLESEIFPWEERCRLLDVYIKITIASKKNNSINLPIDKFYAEYSDWTKSEVCRIQCANSIHELMNFIEFKQAFPLKESKIKFLMLLYLNCYDESEIIRELTSKTISSLNNNKAIYFTNDYAANAIFDIVEKHIAQEEWTCYKTEIAVHLWNYFIQLHRDNLNQFIDAKRNKVLYDFDLVNPYPDYRQIFNNLSNIIPNNARSMQKLTKFETEPTEEMIQSISFNLLAYSAKVIAEKWKLVEHH